MGCERMLTNDKELNATLFDQKTILERFKRAYDSNHFEDEYEIIMKEIDRKLYQEPLTNN